MTDHPDNAPFPFRSGIEPALETIMRDPLVRMVMARDGVTPDQLTATVNTARSRLLTRSLRDADGAA